MSNIIFNPKKICFLLGLFFLMNSAESKEVVYLKDGSIIKGVILEQIPNQSLKIQSSDGSLFVYKMDMVKKILFEEEQPVLAPIQINPPISNTTTLVATPATEEAPKNSKRLFTYYIKAGYNFPAAMTSTVNGTYVDYTCSTCGDTLRNYKGKANLDKNFSIQASVEAPVISHLALGLGASYFTTIKFEHPDSDDLDDLGNILPLFGSARLSTELLRGFFPFLLINLGYDLFFPGPNTGVNATEVGQTITSAGGFFWGTGGGLIFSIPRKSIKLSLEGSYSVSRINIKNSIKTSTESQSFSIEFVSPRFAIQTGVGF